MTSIPTPIIGDDQIDILYNIFFAPSKIDPVREKIPGMHSGPS